MKKKISKVKEAILVVLSALSIPVFLYEMYILMWLLM